MTELVSFHVRFDQLSSTTWSLGRGKSCAASRFHFMICSVPYLPVFKVNSIHLTFPFFVVVSNFPHSF